ARLRRIDRTLLWIEPYVTKDDLVSAADTISQILGVDAVWRDLPDIEAIVEQHFSIIFGPAGESIRWRRGWLVVLFVEEVNAEILRQVHGSAIGDRIRAPIFAVEEDRILCARRQ